MPVSGAAEIAPHIGIADIVVDLVVDRIDAADERAARGRDRARVDRATDRRAATAPAGRRAARARLDELVGALESVLRARGQRYLMANVPRAQLDEVRAVLPGLNGPTVIDIMNGGDHVAVHAVVPARRASTAPSPRSRR